MQKIISFCHCVSAGCKFARNIQHLHYVLPTNNDGQLWHMRSVLFKYYILCDIFPATTFPMTDLGYVRSQFFCQMNRKWIDNYLPTKIVGSCRICSSDITSYKQMAPKTPGPSENGSKRPCATYPEQSENLFSVSKYRNIHTYHDFFVFPM